VQGGIDNAVSELTERENDKVDILAFSVGGVIAWKYGVESRRIGSLYCVSSTRLRHEKIRPEGEIELYFGHRDEYRPDNEWLNGMDVNYEVISDQGHGIYMDQMFAESLSRHIIGKTGHVSMAP